MMHANFGCNILKSQGKFGKLKTIDNGYREICVGALDAYNDIGELYVYTSSVERLLSPGSDFIKNMNSSFLRGEVCHPHRLPGESAEMFMGRALTIDLKNVSHHIRNVRIEDGKDENGRPVKLCIAEVCPSGVHHEMMSRMFDNPDENVAFSIRCLTKPIRLPDGSIGKELHVVITWDLVNSPGITNATKYATPSMESSKIAVPDTKIIMPEDEIITPEMLCNIEDNNVSSFGFESLKATTSMIRHNLGWQKVQTIPVHSATRW